MKTAFKWNSQMVTVLRRVDRVLSDTVEAWRSFDSPEGDINYFRNPEGPSGISEYSRRSLNNLNAIVRELESYQKRISFLQHRCTDSLDKVGNNPPPFRLANRLDGGNLSTNRYDAVKI